MNSPVTHVFPRLSSRFTMWMGLGTWPFFYFVFRERATVPASIGQDLFLALFSGICTLNWTWAYANSARILEVLPNWLKPYWMRFLIYMSVCMGLMVIVSSLALPKFYATILGKNVLFFLLPYLVGNSIYSRKRFFHQAEISPSLFQSQDDVVFQGKLAACRTDYDKNHHELSQPR